MAWKFDTYMAIRFYQNSATRLSAVDNFMVYPNSSKIQLASLTIATIYYFIA